MPSGLESSDTQPIRSSWNLVGYDVGLVLLFVYAKWTICTGLVETGKSLDLFLYLYLFSIRNMRLIFTHLSLGGFECCLGYVS